jgi:hypothetical protein
MMEQRAMMMIFVNFFYPEIHDFKLGTRVGEISNPVMEFIEYLMMMTTLRKLIFSSAF